MQKDEFIFTKTRELQTLENRVKRYWKRLIEEGIKEARHLGKRTVIVNYDFDGPMDSDCIYVYKKDDNVDADALIELTKEKLPKLYEKYHKGKAGYQSNLIELEFALNKPTD